MEVYKNILVPLDGSSVAEAIIPEVEKLAGKLGANVSIVRFVPMQQTVDKPYVKDEALSEAVEYVNNVKRKLEAKGLSVDSDVVFGHDAADEILKHAEAYRMDIIMMSTHGSSGVQRVLLGSVAEKILHHTKNPILLVRMSP